MEIKAPTKNQLYAIRLLIIVGIVAILNFFYWFLDDDLIDNRFLYWALIVAITYSYSRIFYEWYHYWSISVPKEPKVIQEFSVDVLTTYFPGEPYDMILSTLEAIQKITYPHTAYLCDEANDPFLIEKCKELGVIHVTRDNRIDAKAGNINNALRTKATGEICVILDPDHVPLPDFLDHIIPYFSDDEIGYVQVVQSYKNLDESFVAKGAAQQTFQFYGPMMMTMNSYGTVNAIGANCTFRREALDSIGGHAPGLSEDMHTAMQLFAKGWKSVYVPKVVARGLVPSTLTAYYKQQLKWSRGTLELLVSVYPKLFKSFNWRQKLHFGLIPMHYLAGVFYLINFLIPIIALLTSTTPWKGNVIFFGIIAVPVISSTFIIRHYVQRWVMEEDERGFHMVGGLLLISTWWVFILGLWYTIIRKKILYLPTPKDGSDKSSWKIIAPNIIIGCLSLFAIFYGLSKDFTPFTFVMSGFAFVNAFSMFFTVYFSYHTYKKLPEGKKDFREQISSVILSLKVIFWRFRHTLYRLARNYAIPITILTLGVSIFMLKKHNHNQWEGVTTINLQKKEVLFFDTFYPNDTLLYVKSEKSISFKNNIVGVNYKKGNNWYKDNYVLTRKELVKDFDKMKMLNINTIKYPESNIYDRNVLSISKEKGIDVMYSFWIQDDIDYVNDNSKKGKSSINILEKVNSLMNKQNIISWNIGNDVWLNLRKYYRGDELINQRRHYLEWLEKLINDLKKIDSQRIIVVDVEISSESIHYVNVLSNSNIGVDAFGLVVKETTYLNEFLMHSHKNKIPYLYSDIEPKNLQLIEKGGKSLFIRNWQDQYENDKLSFDGLMNKDRLFYANKYTNFSTFIGGEAMIDMPKIKIVKPSTPLLTYWEIKYRAAIFNSVKWEYLREWPSDIYFQWNLIKLDEYKNPIAKKVLGNEIDVVVKIPNNYKKYRLELIVKKDSFITSERVKLHTPLIKVDSFDEI